MSFFAELKRRNVFRVGIAYLIGACPASTDSYLPAVPSITESGTEYLYLAEAV